MSTPESSLVELLAAAAAQACSAFEVASELERTGNPDDEDQRALICAFQYHPLRTQVADQRSQHGVFGPMIEWDGGQYPPAISQVPDRWLVVWAEQADESDSPLVVSRLNDLLWERKAGERPDQRARRAVAAYLELRSSTEPMVAPDSLVRALEISRSLGDDDEARTTAALMADLAEREMQGEDFHPGVTFTLLEAVAELPAELRPAALGDLIEQTKTRYGAEPYNVQAAVELQVTLAGEDLERRKALHAEAVARFKRAADEVTGVLRLAHLQHAIELARQYGLPDELLDLRRELQEVRTDELDLKAISAKVTIPSEELDGLIDQIAGGESWAEALGRLVVVYGPPTGRHEQNVAFVEVLKTHSPLQFLLPSVRLGPEGTVVREIRSDHEHTDAALVAHERLRIHFWSLLSVRALAQTHERLGTPAESDLAAYFDDSLIPPDLAGQFAHAIVLFTQGAYDDAAHSLAPRIERGVREISRRAGLVVSREPVGQDPGGVRQLGLLLSQLQGVLDESWRRYLINTLTEPLGVNLRNRISHGLIGEAQPEDAALLIHVAAYLGTLRVGPRGEGQEPRRE